MSCKLEPLSLSGNVSLCDFVGFVHCWPLGLFPPCLTEDSTACSSARITPQRNPGALAGDWGPRRCAQLHPSPRYPMLCAHLAVYAPRTGSASVPAPMRRDPVSEPPCPRCRLLIPAAATSQESFETPPRRGRPGPPAWRSRISSLGSLHAPCTCPFGSGRIRLF